MNFLESEYDIEGRLKCVLQGCNSVVSIGSHFIGSQLDIGLSTSYLSSYSSTHVPLCDCEKAHMEHFFSVCVGYYLILEVNGGVYDERERDSEVYRSLL
jgi:hypothetical protein